jgi:hypothetical protein
MKKIACLSFLLFVTTIGLSGTAKADRVERRADITLPNKLRDMPWPDPFCKRPPPCTEQPPSF